MTRILALLLVWLLVAASGQAQDAAEQPPVAQAALNFERPEIGAPGTLTVQLPDGVAAKAISVSIPRGQDVVFLPDPELKPSPNADGTWNVPVRLLLEGEHTVERIDIAAEAPDGSELDLVANGVQATINPPSEEQSTPRDYTPAFAPPPNWARLILVGLVALAALAVAALLVALLVRRLLRRERPAGPPPRVATPLEEARGALGSLLGLEVYRVQGSKVHYLTLSELLRRYFEHTCAVPALEMTEDEMAVLLRRRFADRPAALALLRVFDNSSLAKFARVEIDEDRVRRDLDATAAFLDAEDERLRLEAARAANGAREAA